MFGGGGWGVCGGGGGVGVGGGGVREMFRKRAYESFGIISHQSQRGRP